MSYCSKFEKLAEETLMGSHCNTDIANERLQIDTGDVSEWSGSSEFEQEEDLE